MSLQVYSSLKPFAFPENIKAFAEHRLPFPVHVRIKPINACNHNCWFCAYRSDNLELGENMNLRDKIPEEKMSELIEDIISMKVQAVTFSGGGEPLAYPSIDKVVLKLGQHGVKVGCLTNGSLLKGAKAEAFAEAGTWVRVSIDAWDNESYHKSRGVRIGAFDETIRNLEQFSKIAKNCLLGVSYIVTRENHSHLFESLQILKQAGVKTVKLSACVVSVSASENNVYHDALKEVVALEIQKCMSLVDQNFEVVNHYHGMSERFDKSYNRCGIMNFLVIVGADSQIYSCQDKAYTDGGLIGSIQKRSFKDLWLDTTTATRVNSINPMNDCKHHCVAHQKNILIDELTHLHSDHLPFV